MRPLAPLALLLVAGCASTLYGHFAGPAAGSADEAYTCVKEQLQTLGYTRTQYKDETRWFVAQKVTSEQNASGLYRNTHNVLDTQVNVGKDGFPVLDIKARTYEQYANARGESQEEQKASQRVLLDAQALGRACAAK
jgi:hypothetical protein